MGSTINIGTKVESSQETTTINIPSILPTELMDKIRFSVPLKGEESSCDEDSDEITHEVFFGENIRRVLRILTK